MLTASRHDFVPSLAPRPSLVTKPPSNPSISLRGARENSLAGVDIDLPRGRWVAVTGRSGSGKTSLVFDTLVREGERRFLGSLSAHARHAFGKLGRADLDSLTGLPATIAVGQHAVTPHQRSTVGTLTGLLDLLRLLFARTANDPATDPSGEALTRSHFSFNHPLGQCASCRGIGLSDRIDPSKIVADGGKSLRDGALVPTLKNGYTVYSQVTVDVMDTVCRAHGFDVDSPWDSLSDEQRHVILYGSRALKVPFGKHAIESRMKWSGITARPREEGYYRGLVPVMDEVLQRSRNPNILRFVSSRPCEECSGTRLGRPGREAQLGELTLPQALSLPTAELLHELDKALQSQSSDAAACAVWTRTRPPLAARVQRMLRLGLGHLSLDRSSTTLSGGEAQRVRLAAQLNGQLSGVLFALDEPTLGLHPNGQQGMQEILRELLDNGNSLVLVEHDPDMVRHADHVLALGPGAGSEGGRVVAWDGPAAAGHPTLIDHEHPLGCVAPPDRSTRPGSGWIRLTGATLHNLDQAELNVRQGALNVVMGLSGAGKTSLVFGTLLPALQGHTDGGPFETLSVHPGTLTEVQLIKLLKENQRDAGQARPNAPVHAVDARPVGKTPRSTPATWCGLFDLIRKRFAKLDSAKLRGLTASHFSFNSAHGRCPACEGLGLTRVGLHLFEDLELLCDACGGGRYAQSVLEVELAGKTIADVLRMSFREARAFFEHDPPCAVLCDAMLTLGLGYLTLGQSSGSLSRGESQRIKLGTLLGTRRSEPTLVVLDEPDRGLAPTDVVDLLVALHALVEAGHTVLAISHHRQVWAAADHLIELRDGSTLREAQPDWSALSKRQPPPPAEQGDERPIELRGVRTHSLRGIDVAFPRHQLTAVCGVSGSGKSSLVTHTLASEATARFAESLPFQVRRFMRRLPAPRIESASGLGPTLHLGQGHASSRRALDRRSTVATQSECGPLLRLIYSRAGLWQEQPCGLSASHFSRERREGACEVCGGRGTSQRCDPQRLIDAPHRPLLGAGPSTAASGAAGGSRPGRFFTEADGQHMATLVAALVAGQVTDQDADQVADRLQEPALEPCRSPAEIWDLLKTRPWNELPPSVRDMALHGLEDPGSRKPQSLRVQWEFASSAEGDGSHEFETSWSGLCALVEAEADHRARSKRAAEWSAPLADAECPSCSGSGLTQIPRETRVLGVSLPELEQLSLVAVSALFRSSTQDPVLEALRPELCVRLAELQSLGLGHLQLGRPVRTLSSGELQRVRLGGVLRSGLVGLTLVLDEPTAGLHERDVQQLLDRLHTFQQEGNTVVLVSHRPSVLRRADHLLELGPEGGAKGGQLLETGPPERVLSGDGPTARALRARPGSDERTAAGTPNTPLIQLRGAHAHNLVQLDVQFPASGLVCITGVSGSGKSSLLFDVLGASFAAQAPVKCETLDIPGGFERYKALHDARDAHRTTATSSTLVALQLAAPLGAVFSAASAQANSGQRLPARAFKPGNTAGRCPACKGSGREQVSMDFLADVDLPCQVCNGRRFRPEVCQVRWNGKSIVQILEEPAEQLLMSLAALPEHACGKEQRALCAGLTALDDVALGHLPLGRPRVELSGGESARVQLAASLMHSTTPAVSLYDEPSTALHEADLGRILKVFRKLADRGDLVLTTEHRLSAIAAADWVIDLGPEAGADGGRLMVAGPPSSLGKLTPGHTAAALRARS